MTDKQIIIGGVDVSGCKYYDDLDCYAERDCCGYPLECKDNPNCYYKQLKRKEQECEGLKSDLTDLSKIIDCKNGTIFTFKEQLNQLKKENEILEKDKANLAVITETLKVQFKQLKQTLAEIKEIAEKEVNNRMLFADKESFYDFNKILKKINEVDNEG